MAGRWIDLKVDRKNIIWNYETLQDWIHERDRLFDLNINISTKNLDQFVDFYTKTI